MVFIVNLNPFSCGFLTWSARLIFAPAFNHKIGNAAYSGVSKIIVLHEISQMQETSAEEIDNWKATLRDNVF